MVEAVVRMCAAEAEGTGGWETQRKQPLNTTFQLVSESEMKFLLLSINAID